MINQKWIENLIGVLSTKATQPLFSIIEKLKLTILQLYKEFFLIKFLGKWIGKLVYLSLILIVTLGLTGATVKYPTVKIPIF
ncbi:hypothetical protein, partial [Hydrocoleum sp. CS-953]|uniref:hypothetical protein n=1 Tax=Hydrocoleum sp. CS-953 TaxID=1671698 RepID=UPI001AEF6552